MTLLVSCGEYEISDDLAFDTVSGPYIQIRNFANLTVSENTTTTASRTITVEAPLGIYDDVVFTYEFDGTAEYGVDFTVAGATADGGAETIVYDEELYGIDALALTITYLTDGVDDGNKTLIIRLTSATVNGETINVGRNGVGASKTITIQDID